MEYMLKNRLGRLPRTLDEIGWVTSFLNDTPYNGKDLDGVIIGKQEMLRFFDKT